MKKHLYIALSAIFVIFLVLGIVLNSQRGLEFQDNFWSMQKDGRYSYGRSWIKPLGGSRFEAFLDGEAITAEQSTLPDGGVRMDFSDGWALERSSEKDFFYEFSSFAWSADAVLILTDMEKQDFKFAAAAREERIPILDANSGEIIAESVRLFSEEGDFLNARDVWFHPSEYSAPEQETIVLKDGARLPARYSSYVLQNEDGEYLLDALKISRINLGNSDMDRGDLTYLMLQIGEGRNEARGDATAVFFFVLLYALGAAQMLFPEKLAFLGSRWQYKNTPELSDAGVTAMQISGAVLILLGILLLFIEL